MSTGVAALSSFGSLMPIPPVFSCQYHRKHFGALQSAPAYCLVGKQLQSQLLVKKCPSIFLCLRIHTTHLAVSHRCYLGKISISRDSALLSLGLRPIAIIKRARTHTRNASPHEQANLQYWQGKSSCASILQQCPRR